VRFSFSRYNTMEEVERVIAAVPPIIAQLRKLSPYWGEKGPVEDPQKAFAPLTPRYGAKWPATYRSPREMI
jgi:cysteine desulfurase